MRKLHLLLIFLFIGALFTSCEKHDNLDQLKAAKSVKVEKTPLLEMATWPLEGCDLMIFDLMAGQTNYVGSVQAIIDGTDLVVKYDAIEGCEFTEAHLFVGDIEAEIPAGQSGNPKIGHFPYFWENQGGEDEVIFRIALEDLGLVGRCIKIAAHAVVVCPDGEETAWARGSSGGIFAVKSRMDSNDDPLTEDVFAITGDPDSEYCNNFTYYSIAEALQNPIDLVEWWNGVEVKGTVTAVESAGIITFTITTNITTPVSDGRLRRSYLFVGSVDEFDNLMSIPDCDGFKSFPSIITPEGATEHVFNVAASALETASEFDGSRWGWYVSYCSDCI